MERIISNAMKKQVVALYYQKIGDTGVKYLCERDTTKVKKLYLTQNSITAIGALHFKQAKWNVLIELWLCNNQMGNQGCLYLSRASTNSLEKLDQNRIGSSGLSHLAKARRKQLNAICLNFNKISCNITTITKTHWKLLNYISWCINNKLIVFECLAIILSETAIKQIYFAWDNIKSSETMTIRKAIKDKFGQIQMKI